MEPLPAQLAERLSHAGAHPHDPGAAGGVEWIQTHLSHVFLTRDRVYKLRKAVDLGFVDFARRDERNADCLRELRLNRRLAPDVYLGVAPIEPGDGSFRVGALAEAIERPELEHVVVMRRLPAGCDALSMLERGALRAAHLDAIAVRLARFHAGHGLGTPSPFSPEAWLEAVQAPMRATLESLAAAAGRLVPRISYERLRARSDAFVERHRDAIEARRRAGRAVDGHGDVHLQHVWFEPGAVAPLLIDCIEFSDGLRRIDAAAEVAFLAMDLRYRGRPRLAERFLRVYARERDDYDLYRPLDWFVSYRAAVRAKVAALAADDAAIGPAQRALAARSARRHLALALRALLPRPRGALVLVAGLVGTGKSTAAEVLADAAGGVVVASDRVRKALHGLAPTERGGAGLYDSDQKDAVYAALLERAEPVVESGRVAVLDATYAEERHRRDALAWAARHARAACVVETTCAAETALARLARREARGTDASDAGPSLYAWSAAHFEPIRGVERRVVRTDAPHWRAALRGLARELRGGRTEPREESARCPSAASPS